MIDDSLFGRLVIFLIFGPPFGVIYFIMEKREAMAVALLLIYLLLSYPGIKWLDEKKIVRKSLSGPLVGSLSIVCLAFFYGKFA